MKYHFQEIQADHLTPIGAYHALAGRGSCILESAGGGRYSFIGLDPIASLKAKGNAIEICIDGKIDRFEADPYEALRSLQKRMDCKADHPLAVFTGGAVGYITYDAVRFKEKIPDRHPDSLQLPDFFFQFYRSNVVFDHDSRRAVLASLDASELDAMNEKLGQAKPLKPVQRDGKREIECDLSDEAYGIKVEKAKEYICAGDAFQVVLSRTFKVKTKAPPFQIYRALRQASPAPFLFFFDLEGYAIAGASPEKIISVQGRKIESTPIAGTRALDGEDLLSDPKEIAEHVMLVDLARNDVGSVSIPGTVRVPEYKQVQSFSHVQHIVSKVTGELAPQYDALDAFKASFPAGTLSGAPKVRAMELIDEIEISRRGLYGGAIVALDPKGNLTSCIAIRTALIKDGEAFVRSGAGVVADSDPCKEAEETKIKAKGVLEAIL